MNFTEHPIAQMKLKNPTKLTIKSWYFTLQCAVERSFLGCEASKQKGLLYDD